MLTDKSAIFIGQNLPHLEHLGIMFCSNLTDSALLSFSRLRNLRSLRLRKGPHFTSGGFEGLFSHQRHSTHDACANHESSKKNYGLHTLDLSECQELADGNLQSITSKLPNLRNLAIEWCFKISDTGLAALTSNCKHLVTLKLVGLKYARCEPLFISPLTKLVELDLCQTDLVDDNKLHALKQGRPWLKIIDYYGEEITEED